METEEDSIKMIGKEVKEASDRIQKAIDNAKTKISKGVLASESGYWTGYVDCLELIVRGETTDKEKLVEEINKLSEEDRRELVENLKNSVQS